MKVKTSNSVTMFYSSLVFSESKLINLNLENVTENKCFIT